MVRILAKQGIGCSSPLLHVFWQGTERLSKALGGA